MNERLLPRMNDVAVQIELANDLADVYMDNDIDMSAMQILDLMAQRGLMLMPNFEKNVASEAFMALASSNNI